VPLLARFGGPPSRSPDATGDLQRLIRSLVLPFAVVVVIPLFSAVRPRPFGLKLQLPIPAVQVPLGLVLFAGGFALFLVTVRLFHLTGKGTLAPWDPTRRLVTQGVYRYTRNPMISAVLCMLLGEAALLGSRRLLLWALIFFAVNTAYFKLFEEPGLKRRFGAPYVTYRRNVPLWIPRIRPWNPDRGERRDGPTPGS